MLSWRQTNLEEVTTSLRRNATPEERFPQPTMIVRILILLQTFLAFEILTEVVGANYRCYVCIPNTGSSISDVLQMFPEGTVIPLCNQFDTDKPEFIRECPSPSFQGCLTQTNGSHITKTCTEVGIEDCKTANKIKYCYCKGDLCNREPVPTEAPAPPEMSTDDDEDSPSEGSGSPEGSDSRQIETSSETDLGLEVFRQQLPTTTKSVILTTPHPRGPAKASSGPSNRPPDYLRVLPFLIVLRFSLLRVNF